MLKIKYANKYYLQERRLLDRRPELEEVISLRTHWFRKNQNDTRLHNHKLHKRLEDKWAISITDDIRIVYEWLGKSMVRFLTIGTHPQVYRK